MRKLLLTLALFTSVALAEDETMFSNLGGYANIELEEGLQQKRVLIVDGTNVYFGKMDEDGDFIALGRQGGASVWGKQEGHDQIIVLKQPAADSE